MCFGEFAGYLCGCNLGLELTISAAAVARGWTSYVATLFRAAPDAFRIRIAGDDGEGARLPSRPRERAARHELPGGAPAAGAPQLGGGGGAAAVILVKP